MTGVLTDSLVDWSVDDESSKDSDQDDRETDEGSVDQHDRVLVRHLGHAVVVEAQACQSDDLQTKKRYLIKILDLGRKKSVEVDELKFCSIKRKLRS